VGAGPVGPHGHSSVDGVAAQTHNSRIINELESPVGLGEKHMEKNAGVFSSGAYVDDVVRSCLV
jgi:hypothetical protein